VTSLLAVLPSDVLAEAVPIFASSLRDANRYWNRLEAMKDRAPSDKAAVFDSAAAAIPLGNLLKLRRSDITSRVLSPSARACEIRLGTRHRKLQRSALLAEKITELRERLKVESGLAIPGVRVAVSKSEPSDALTFRVFEQVVSRTTLTHGPGAESIVAERFESIVADNLFRWIAVDDLDLWNVFWSFDSEPKTALPVDLVDRVRLTRILRTLLSEGISIADRTAIMDGFNSVAGGPIKGDGLSLLTAVRRRLYPAIIADTDEPVVPVPAQLEQSIAEALDRKHLTMRRDSARRLQRELRAWRTDELPDGPLTISVTTTSLRPIVWHLLAADRPRIYVVAEDEITNPDGRG